MIHHDTLALHNVKIGLIAKYTGICNTEYLAVRPFWILYTWPFNINNIYMTSYSLFFLLTPVEGHGYGLLHTVSGTVPEGRENICWKCHRVCMGSGICDAYPYRICPKKLETFATCNFIATATHYTILLVCWNVTCMCWVKPRSHQALRRHTTTCDGYRGPSCDVARRLSDREASYDVLVGLVMSKNLAMLPGIVGYREINVRRRGYSYDIWTYSIRKY